MLLQCEYKHAAKLLQYVFTTNKYCCSYLLSADTTSSSPPSEQLNEGNFLKDQKLSGCNFFSYKQHLKDQSTRAGRIPPQHNRQLGVQEVQNAEHWPSGKVREEHWYR